MIPLRPLAIVLVAISLTAGACGDDTTALDGDATDASAVTTATDDAGGGAGPGDADPDDGDAGSTDDAGDATARVVEHARGTTEVPVDPRRVVALGEEFLLADLLALGITPVASTATVPAAGFIGIDPALTADVAALSATEPDLERLAALAPDLVVATAFVWDELGGDLLGRIAPTIAVGTDDWRADVELLGAALGSMDAADAALADYDAAIAAGRAGLAGVEVSLATIYPGPSPAVWVDGPSNVPAVLIDLGVVLVPGRGDVGDVRNGRAFLSLEQLGLLDAPRLVLAQSGLVEGEDAALAAIVDTPLWPTLPAVRNGTILTIDRLGYPGVTGRTRLAVELASSLGG